LSGPVSITRCRFYGSVSAETFGWIIFVGLAQGVEEFILVIVIVIVIVREEGYLGWKTRYYEKILGTV
jgi:hypothetical protein